MKQYYMDSKKADREGKLIFCGYRFLWNGNGMIFWIDGYEKPSCGGTALPNYLTILIYCLYLSTFLHIVTQQFDLVLVILLVLIIHFRNEAGTCTVL